MFNLFSKHKSSKNTDSDLTPLLEFVECESLKSILNGNLCEGLSENARELAGGVIEMLDNLKIELHQEDNSYENKLDDGFVKHYQDAAQLLKNTLLISSEIREEQIIALLNDLQVALTELLEATSIMLSSSSESSEDSEDLEQLHTLGNT